MGYFTCQAQRSTNCSRFYLISNSWWNPRWRPCLVTSQASSSATTHKIYLMLLRRSKAFHWGQNRFEILQHLKTLGRGSINLLLYYGGAMTLRVCPSVKYLLGFSPRGPSILCGSRFFLYTILNHEKPKTGLQASMTMYYVIADFYTIFYTIFFSLFDAFSLLVKK